MTQDNPEKPDNAPQNPENREDDAQIKAFAELLDRLPEVREHDETEVKQAQLIAEGLTDIVDEAEEIAYHFDLLRSPNLSDAKRLQALKDIGEALRHLDYHIHDMAFFDAYVDEVEQ